MKLVKLSLVAALAAGSFSALSAKPLEEAIKNVEVSGALRYRFDSVSWQGKANKAGGKFPGTWYGIGDNNNNHRFRAFTGIKLDAGDNFKIFGQIMYNNDKNGGWGSSNLTQTKNPLVLKQAYLQYDVADAGLSLILGKQELGTIWTADFVGTAAKVLFTPAEGLTVAGFIVDSFEGDEGDGDAFSASDVTHVGNDTSEPKINISHIYRNNMYGAAVLANFAGLNAQVWGAHWDRLATLYAVNLKYTLGFGGNDNAGVKLTYLGNSPTGYLKNVVADDAIGAGNLVDGRLFANVAGLDAKVGGIFYGKKDKVTLNTLEDTSGPDLYIGREIFYADGTALVQTVGQNVFGYVGVGYTLPADFRIGVQGVFGQNKTTDTEKQTDGTLVSEDVKTTMWEGVVELGYKANKNLSFETWYSYLNGKVKGSDAGNKQTVRFQALYKF